MQLLSRIVLHVTNHEEDTTSIASQPLQSTPDRLVSRIGHRTGQAAPACSQADQYLLTRTLEQLLLSGSSSFSCRQHCRHHRDSCLHCTFALLPIISTSCLYSAAQATPPHEPPPSSAHLHLPPHVGSLAVLPASAVLATMARHNSMRSRKNSEKVLKLLGRRKNRQIVSP